MRIGIIFSLLTGLGVALFVGCNSQEGPAGRGTNPLIASSSPQTSQPPHQVQNPADNARRITAEELHTLWQNNNVLIVDTRNEASFNQSHIKGAILIPAGEFAARADELPKNKMIATYCT
jgi:3-mercaptopyruvate sulfurtransferase SseA